MSVINVPKQAMSHPDTLLMNDDNNDNNTDDAMRREINQVEIDVISRRFQMHPKRSKNGTRLPPDMSSFIDRKGIRHDDYGCKSGVTQLLARCA